MSLRLIFGKLPSFIYYEFWRQRTLSCFISLTSSMWLFFCAVHIYHLPWHSYWEVTTFGSDIIQNICLNISELKKMACKGFLPSGELVHYWIAWWALMDCANQCIPCLQWPPSWTTQKCHTTLGQNPFIVTMSDQWMPCFCLLGNTAKWYIR